MINLILTTRNCFKS